jgi:tetratricopeptide (TPR) repeat protein
MDALAARSALWIRRNQFDSAKKLLQRAIKIDPSHPRIVDLFVQVLERSAEIARWKASDLRETKTWSDCRWIYWRLPTASELELAGQYERHAGELIDLARAALQAASRPETPEGLFFRGLVASRDGDFKSARAWLSESIRLRPSDDRARRLLVSVLSSLGEFVPALEEQAALVNMFETTAVPLLRGVWDCVRTKRWASARKLLARAAQIDPADPRIAAYFGVVCLAEEKKAEAASWFRAALAIARAREELARGRRLTPSGYGFALAVRLRLQRLLDPAEAEILMMESVALEPRIPHADFVLKVPWALLPHPDLEAATDNVLGLVAWSREALGAAQFRSNKYAQAIATLLPIHAYDHKLMTNGVGLDRLEYPRVYSSLWLAKSFLALGKPDEARPWAGKVPGKRVGPGPTENPHAELEEEGTRLHEELDRRKKAEDEAGMGDPDEILQRVLKEADLPPGPPAGATSEGMLYFAIRSAAQALAKDNRDTNWKSGVAWSIAKMAAEREARAADLQRLKDPDRRPGDRLLDTIKDLEAAQKKSQEAIRWLKKIAVERGYPADSLDRDVADAMPARRR